MRYSDELFSKGLTIKLIDKLRKVKRYGSKTEAAKVDPKTKDSTGYTGPLSKLEKLVGPQLMAKHSSALTTAGEDFLRAIEKFCTELDDFGALHGDRRTDVVIGTHQSLIISWWLPEVYPDLKKVFPEINFVFRNLRTNEVKAGLENGELDLGVMRGGATPALKRQGGIPGGYQLAVPKRFRVKLDSKLTDLKPLEKYTCVLMEGGGSTRTAIEELIKKKGLLLDKRLELSSWIQISTALERGLGFAVVPDHVVKNLNESRIAAYPLKNTQKMGRGELGLFYRKIRLDERPTVERIKDRILKHMD